MRSDATTVDAYVAGLPSDRRETIAAVRATILANLPAGFVEAMGHGMIAYVVPLAMYPDTYNGEPLLYAALASQKNHVSVYLMGIYGSHEVRARFEAEYRATGSRLDVGKSCVRFRRLADLPLDVVGRSIAAVSCADYIALAKAARETRGSGRRRPAAEA